MASHSVGSSLSLFRHSQPPYISSLKWFHCSQITCFSPVHLPNMVQTSSISSILLEMQILNQEVRDGAQWSMFNKSQLIPTHTWVREPCFWLTPFPGVVLPSEGYICFLPPLKPWVHMHMGTVLFLDLLWGFLDSNSVSYPFIQQLLCARP